MAPTDLKSPKDSRNVITGKRPPIGNRGLVNDGPGPRRSPPPVAGTERELMHLFSMGIGLLGLAGMAFADTITLKSSGVIQGTYLGGTARQVRVDTGDQIQTLNVNDVSRIEFSGSASVREALMKEPAAVRAPEPAPAPGRTIYEVGDQVEVDGWTYKLVRMSPFCSIKNGRLAVALGIDLIVRNDSQIPSHLPSLALFPRLRRAHASPVSSKTNWTAVFMPGEQIRSVVAFGCCGFRNEVFLRVSGEKRIRKISAHQVRGAAWTAAR